MTSSESDALVEAIKAGRLDAVEGILDASPALVAARPAGGPSPILLALYYRHPEIADAFVRRGAKLDVFEAAALGDAQTLADLVREDPARAGAFAEDGFFPLGLASFFGRRDAVRILLDAGADVHAAARNQMRVQALHAAAAAHDAQVAERLVRAGARLDLPSDDGKTARDLALEKGHRDLVARLDETAASRTAARGPGGERAR